MNIRNPYLNDLMERIVRRDPQEREFHQGQLIGRVLGYQLGIGDAWVALRMEEMLRRGLLEAVTQAPPDRPAYHRILRRTEAFDRLYAGERLQ